MKIETCTPGFNKLECILVDIESEETITNSQGQLETFTVLLAKDNYFQETSDKNRKLIRTWFPGRIHSDTIGQPFKYFIGLATSQKSKKSGKYSYVLFFPNIKSRTGNGRIYRRHFTGPFLKFEIPSPYK